LVYLVTMTNFYSTACRESHSSWLL
jgi:hypothetical protein